MRSSTALALLLILFPSVGLSDIYDVQTQWSDTDNPNGVWTCRGDTTVLPLVPDWTPLGASFVQPAWAPSAISPNFIPAWIRLAGDLTGLDAVAGNILVHSTDGASGADTAHANLIWTAPSAGTASIFGDIWLARNIGRSNDWMISLNDTVLTTGSVTSTDVYSRTNPMPFSMGSGGAGVLIDIAVDTGDIIELRIIRTSQFGDWVGIHMIVDHTPDVTGVQNALVPQTLNLVAYPNPLSAATTIRFELADDAWVTLDVYSIQGQRARSLARGSRAAGPQSVNWDGTDDDGNVLPPGVYFVRLTAGETQESGRLLLLR